MISRASLPPLYITATPSLFLHPSLGRSLRSLCLSFILVSPPYKYLVSPSLHLSWSLFLSCSFSFCSLLHIPPSLALLFYHASTAAPDEHISQGLANEVPLLHHQSEITNLSLYLSLSLVSSSLPAHVLSSTPFSFLFPPPQCCFLVDK